MAQTKLTNKHREVAALLTFVLVLSITPMLAPKANAQTTHNIAMSNFAINPQSFIIRRGDTIKWSNNDPVIHMLWFARVSDGSTYLVSDPILPGTTWSHTFADKISLQYYDLKHLWVAGSVKVVGHADLNGDGVIDIIDLAQVSAHWYPGPPIGPLGFDPYYDLNGDGAIDVAERGIVSAYWTGPPKGPLAE